MSLRVVRQLAMASVADRVPDQQGMQRAVDAALAALAETHQIPVGQREIAVRVVETSESRSLNRQWRGKDYATNVLAFPSPPGLPVQPGELAPAGDLVICAEIVAREAAEQGKSAADHWAHMVIHGSLHLIGLDHISESDAMEMEDVERRALARLGMANPYL